MSAESDETVTLRESESSVLVQHAPISQPPVDPTPRLGGGSPVTVDVRFGDPPRAGTSGVDAATADVVVAAAEADGDDDDARYAIDGPDDLTGYGMALTDVIADADAPLVVRIDSLTALLQDATVDEAFRFVHVLGGRVSREDAVLLAGVDADSHDDRTVAQLLQPFDVTVTGSDGTVRRR